MQNIEKLRAMAALEAAAAKQNIPVGEFVIECEKAIEAAWAVSKPEAIRWQEQLFPEGKPSVVLFVARLGELFMGF